MRSLIDRCALQVKERAKRKRKGKLGAPQDGLWPHGMVWFAYILTGFFCLCCGWYTVLVALSFGPETTGKWLGGFISTLAYQSIIQDPLKIGLVILFMDSAEFWLELYVARLRSRRPASCEHATPCPAPLPSSSSSSSSHAAPLRAPAGTTSSWSSYPSTFPS